MQVAALDEIHRFTKSVEQPNLYAYLDIDLDAAKDTITHALQVRRSWAQGQQANPKFRSEALWVIKNIGLMKEALTSGASAYKKDLSDREDRSKLEKLSIFIKGTLADGELTARGEEAIQREAESMGLPEALVLRRIGEILAEQDAIAMETLPPVPLTTDRDGDTISNPLDGIENLYDVLDTSPDTPQEDLEDVYRRRYRWARQLRNTEHSSRVYSRLDEAWRTLKDPQKRAEYDATLRGDSNSSPEQPVERGFLPPPPPKVGLKLPMPSVEQHLERVHASEQAGHHAPTITMPSIAPSPPAPPPPSLPEPEAPTAVSVDIDEMEEPEIFVEDESTEEATRAQLAMLQQLEEEQEKEAGSDVVSVSDSPIDEEDAEDVTDPGIVTASPPPPEPQVAAKVEKPSSEDPTQPMTLESLLGDGAKDFMGDFIAIDDFVEPDASTSNPMTASRAPRSQDDGLDIPRESVVRRQTGSGPALAAGQIFNDLAVLRVDGGRVIRVRTGTNPYPVRLTIRNEGEGSMPGTVTANVPWIQISPAELNPTRKMQVVEALVEPEGIAGNAAKGVVTIETEHGESRSVTIDAIKYIISPVTMFVLALTIVGVVGLMTGLYLSGIIGSKTEEVSRTVFAVNVDPPAGEVYIDDQLVGNQGTMSMTENFPIGTPFQLRVELDGFEPFVRNVEVSPGSQLRVEVDLELRDTVDFEPPEDMTETTVDGEALDLLLERRAPSIDACFTRNLRNGEPFDAELTVSAVVTARGFIQGVRFSDANFTSPPVENCLRRQLRAFRLPLLPGDFARFERRLGAEIRGVNVLNGNLD